MISSNIIMPECQTINTCGRTHDKQWHIINTCGLSDGAMANITHLSSWSWFYPSHVQRCHQSLHLHPVPDQDCCCSCNKEFFINLLKVSGLIYLGSQDLLFLVHRSAFQSNHILSKPPKTSLSWLHRRMMQYLRKYI